MLKKLSDILFSLEHECVELDGQSPDTIGRASSAVVSSLAFDSHDVLKDSLFFALPGIHTNGNTYIPSAIESGASAIVFEGDFDNGIKAEIRNAVSNQIKKHAVPPLFVKVPDARFAMAPLSDAFYDSPSKKLIVIGVTGTEGKSSTVSFIWQLLQNLGKKAGFVSTVQYSWGGNAIDNTKHQTTPEAPVIQHHLYKMVENGCEYAVIEASSHGLSKKLNRLGNVLFDCGVFMNVTLEHLEFHKTFEQYRSDKANLFRALDEHDHIKCIAGHDIKVPAFGVVNLDDASSSYFAECTRQNVYGFTTAGLAGKAAAETGAAASPLPPIPLNMRYMMGRNIAAARFGLSFTADTDGASSVYPEHYDPSFPRTRSNVNITSHLAGAFNAYNIMAALIAVSGMTGMPFSVIAPFVRNLLPVKGRMTVIDRGQPFEVIVDYAHTPSSFETIFPPLRKRCRGRMFALFGSGGERDVKKRPLQGEIAAKFCDVLMLSDEDPRGENPTELLQDIAAGAKRMGKKIGIDIFIEPDRKKAIRRVFKMAQAGDIVLLLGKAHENSIIYKECVMPYDEISEAESALSEMGYTC